MRHKRIKTALALSLLSCVVFLALASTAYVVRAKLSPQTPLPTIITETYFADHDGNATTLANAYATKMEKPGRHITIKIYAEESKGILGVLVITTERSH